MNDKNKVLTEGLSKLIPSLYKYLKGRLDIKEDLNGIKFMVDSDDSSSPLIESVLISTGYYNPLSKEIAINIQDRHPKDILRSFAHEMLHFKQDLDGKFNDLDSSYSGEGYAQKNPHLRKMEMDAYLRGNTMFRDWEDSIKKNNYELYESLNGSSKTLLTEQQAFGQTETDQVHPLAELETMRMDLVSSGTADSASLFDFDSKFMNIIEDLFEESNFELTSKETGYGYDFSSDNAVITVMPFGQSGLKTKTNKDGSSDESEIYIQTQITNRQNNEEHIYGKSVKTIKKAIEYIKKVLDGKE